jgi:hypothetical protein
MFVKIIGIYIVTIIQKSFLIVHPIRVGYSVIRPVVDRCLGRTIIDPLKLSRIDRNNFFSLRTKFETHIGGRHFEIFGYPYISQDGDVTVCAHTALWGVCRYLSERYPVYGEVYPFDLINFTDLTRGRKFPYRGMTYSDYSSILSEFGAYPIILSLKTSDSTRNIDEFRNLYTYVESGFPVIASYSGHVVTLIGHTLDYDKNVTASVSGFIDSSEFIKDFVVVDDNYFPYQYLCENGYNHGYNNKTADDIVIAVCPLPEKVFLPAEKAREWALTYLTGLRVELGKTGNGPFVTRLFLTTNSAFKRRCLQRINLNGNIDRILYFIAEMNLPHFIWVMETGPLSLYRQGKCSGEVVLDSTAGDLQGANIYVRIGNSLWFDGDKYNDSTTPNNYPQYTHNLGEK